MAKRVIASAVDSNDLMRAFHDLVAERWDNWDLTPFLVYLVDTCDPSALPYLAEQFDVSGVSGFEVAENEEQQRGLIKKSIALHKYMGTPWAVKEACNAVGFTVMELVEGVTAPGKEPAATDWAQFKVVIEIPDTRSVNEYQLRKLKMFIEIYKNARSHLIGIDFVQYLTDGPLFSGVEGQEDISLQFIPYTDLEVFIDRHKRYVTDKMGRTLSYISGYSALTGLEKE